MADNGKYTDQELLFLLNAGDADAFTVLYRHYHDVLYLYAYRLTEDEGYADDIVQDIFLSLWEKRGSIDERIILKPYLLRAARYKYLNIIQHLKVRQKTVDDLQHYLDEAVYHVDDHIEEKELFERLQMIVERLPGKMADVFRMRQDNVPDEQIADRLGISEKTVKNLMSQTMKALHQRFRSFFFFLF
ncbi:RNA polymerase sigma factor [Parapedobacter sp. 2B3]|uniref:RNA polymerase sigma factor n=1 Tax=Parapedobacter sp. 2B3 TaxID=3342381 RepID=UPI0035B57719